MKILIVSQMFYPESFQINDLALSLVAQGYDVTVLTGQPNYPEGKFYKGYGFFGPFKENYFGVKIIRVPLVPRYKSRFYNLAINYISFIFFILFFGLPRVLKQDYDLVFSWASSPITMALPGVFISKIKKCPHYIWVQDLWPETLISLGVIKGGLPLYLIGSIVKWIYSGSKKILIQSMSFKENVLKWGGSEEKIIYFPNWANEIFENKLNELKVKKNEIKIKFLFAGNLGKAQGLDNLVKVLAEITDVDYELDIYGDGSEKLKLEKLIFDKNLKDKIFLKGRRSIEEMPALYQEYDALVVSLIDDEVFEKVLPSKVQTYLASGKPIIAIGAGELKRLINESQSGFISSPEDKKALIENIRKFSRLSISDRIIMGSHSRIYYEKYFLKSKLLNLLINDFKKVS